MRIPTTARLSKVPELGHGLTLRENEDKCEGEEDKLAGHEEVEQPAGPSLGHADAIDEKANGELAESQAQDAEGLGNPVELERVLLLGQGEIEDMSRAADICVDCPHDGERQRPYL